MSFKFKNNKDTTLSDALSFIEELKKANVNDFLLNDFNKLFDFLNVEEIPSNGGSSIRFRHQKLKGHPHFLDGIFTIHVIHKGGNQKMITKFDFKAYMLAALKQIIELLDKQK